MEAKAPDESQLGISKLSAGTISAGTIKADGSVVVWFNDGGFNEQGVPRDYPLVVTNQLPAVDLALSRDHRQLDLTLIAILHPDGSMDFGTDFTLPVLESRPKYMSGGVAAITFVGTQLVVAKDDGSLLVDGKPVSENFATPASPGGIRALAGNSQDGAFTAIGLRGDGTVVGWDVYNKKSVGIPADALSSVVAIAAGRFHFLALKADGSVVAWGNVVNWDAGQTVVPLAARTGVKAIAAGDLFSMALKTDGTVVLWGAAPAVESVPPEIQGITLGIAAGVSQAMAIVVSGPPNLSSNPVSRSVPLGQSAELIANATGPGLSYQWHRNGVRIPNATTRALPLLFAAPGEYSVGITNWFGSVTSLAPAVVTVAPPVPGSVVARGAGEPKREGQDDWGQSTVPLEASKDIVATAGGAQHSLGLRRDGSVVAWGDNLFGECDVPVGARTNVEAISAGYFHSLALTRSGSVIQWGSANFWQGKVPPSLDQGVIAISTQSQHSLALKQDGSVVAWGENFNGQTTVPAEAKSGVIAIAAGGVHSLALKADGSVVAWGDKTNGGFVPPSASSNVVAIAAGYSHSLALRRDGSVVGWGTVEVPANLGSGVVAIAAGPVHSLALRADGTVAAWGDNSAGQLEIPSTLQGSVTAIAVGGLHTLLILGSADLRVERTTTSAVASWPTNQVGLHLQSSVGITPDAPWADVIGTPSILGRRHQLEVPTAASSRYLRLSR